MRSAKPGNQLKPIFAKIATVFVAILVEFVIFAIFAIFFYTFLTVHLILFFFFLPKLPKQFATKFLRPYSIQDISGKLQDSIRQLFQPF